MRENILKIFEVNTDAVATNKGFYYQYLVVLKKWIQNFISEKNDFIYSEVDDDIKEVGDELIFTQVKCYTKGFSFHSVEIRKSIFNFFMLFLKYNEELKIKFCFNSNTSVLKSDKLLKAWIGDPTLKDDIIRNQCHIKIYDILITEINNRRRKKLENTSISLFQKEEIKVAANDLKNELSNLTINKFIDCINWVFINNNPDEAIKKIFHEIRLLLSHEKFQNISVLILENVLLSEIYQCSQAREKENRVLLNKTITNILLKTENELEAHVNYKLLKLLNVQFEQLTFKIEKVQKKLKEHSSKIKDLSENVNVLQRNDFFSKLPKNLTLIPNSPIENIYGRDDSLNDLKRILSKTRILYITGTGGIGKTFLVQKFLSKVQKNYDYFIWINSIPSLIEAFILNESLILNLNLNFASDDSIDHRFQMIINHIAKISGKLLLIIDNFENDNDTLKKLSLLINCHIIITTRSIIEGLPSYKLPILDLDSAKNVYFENLNREVETDESVIIDFLKFIEFNPLVIKLCTKTISYSIDLDLSKLYNHLKDQTFDDEELKIDLFVLEENTPIRILSFLQKTFELKNLTSLEKYILEFLSLLPAEEIIIDDLAQIGGEENYKINKITFTNCINSLHQKGWVERNEGVLKMHRLIQELIKYNIRKNTNGFVANIFLITWLTHRIKEVAAYNPSKSFKFLKYAESILSSIKEPYRKSIYQPLLLLENELLNAYQWVYESQSIHDRWVDLTRRAENHLNPDDVNLGTIYNNIALSFFKKNDITNSFLYIHKSINTLHKNESKAVNNLINAYCGLSHLYIEEGNLIEGVNSLKIVLDLRKKYSLNEDQQIAIQYNIIGFGYLKINNLEKAIMFFERAVKEHLRIPKEFRNDFHLVLYYSNLAFTFFTFKEDEKTKIYLQKTSLLLETINLSNNYLIENIYESFILIYEYYGYFDKAKKFRDYYK